MRKWKNTFALRGIGMGARQSVDYPATKREQKKNPKLSRYLSVSNLTPRELEVAEILSDTTNFTVREVAKVANCRVGYVKSVAYVIYDKLGINTRKELKQALEEYKDVRSKD